MHAAEAFVPLHRYLFGGRDEVSEPAAAVSPGSADESPDDVAVSESVRAEDEVLREVRLFRARLTEAFEDARDALVGELAYAVLGRELRLASADVGTIAARILAEHPAATPVRLRVAPEDAAAADVPVPVVADAALAPGDAVLEFANGFVDARLGIRVARLLEDRW